MRALFEHIRRENTRRSVHLLRDRIAFRGYSIRRHYSSAGALLAVERTRNLVVDEGRELILDTALSASTQVTNFYVGLKDTGTPGAAWTMASGPTEIHTVYSQSTRPAWTENDSGSPAKTVSNSSSPASFSITGTDSIVGGFLTTNSTKGGTTGTLIAAWDFSAARAVSNGDTLNVTYSLAW